MSDAALHVEYERVMAEALRADDPVRAVRDRAERTDCPQALKAWLLAACRHEAGLRLSA